MVCAFAAVLFAVQALLKPHFDVTALNNLRNPFQPNSNVIATAI